MPLPGMELAVETGVAFLTWNLPEQVTAFYGLLKIGGVPVPINYRLAPNEVKFIVNDCGARLFVFEEALRALSLIHICRCRRAI